jgi:uncharacterized protein with HEPN domain
VSRSDGQRIADILDAATELAEIVARGKAAFLEDSILRRAAERLLEIIGEAANTISPETKNRYPGIGWRDVARLRIVLAHHYQRVDPGQVWTIAEQDVPPMCAQLSGEAPPA